MESYEAYLQHEAGNVLPLEEALQIYNDVYETVHSCKNEEKDEFVGDFLNAACAYAAMRNQWEFWTLEKKMEKDSLRTSMHNAFIDSVNILSRFLNSEGIATPWIEQLGDARKRIGDFACFVSYMVGISNR